MRTSEMLEIQISELYLEKSTIYNRRTAVYNEISNLWRHHTPGSGMVDTTALDAELASSHIAIDALDLQISRLRSQRDSEREFERIEYRRPTAGLLGLLSRQLGALPSRSVIIQPTRENLRRIRTQVPLALLTLFGAVASLITLSVFVPWLRVSPYSIIYSLCETVFGEYAGWIAFAIAVVMMLLIGRGTTVRGYRGKFLDTLAMGEEQWFRMGAENWSGKQRLYGCVAFGFMHVVNIIYPLTSLIVLSGVGGVFLLAYLRAYRRTGNNELATLTSTKLHATYNRFGIIYMIAALSVTAYVSFAMR